MILEKIFCEKYNVWQRTFFLRRKNYSLEKLHENTQNRS